MLYRYASTIDRFDAAGLRSVLADDLWAQYGNAEPVSGGDAVAGWIGEAIANVVWQHHLLSVYHVEVEGDRATALVYHTSHQVFEDAPDTAKLLVGPLPQRAAARARTAGGSAGSCSRSCGARRRRTPPATSP